MPCSHFRIGGLCSCALCSKKVFFYNQNICTLNVGFWIFTNISAQQARVKIALLQDSLHAGLQPAKQCTDTLELPPTLHAFRASPLPGFYPTFHDMDAIDDHSNPSNQIRTNWTFNTQTSIQPDAIGMRRFAHLYLRTWSRTTRRLNVLNKNTMSLHPPSLTAGHKITKLFIAQCKSVRKVDLARIKTQIVGDCSFFEKSEDIFTYLGWCLPFESSPTQQFQHYKISVQISCRKSSKKVLG